MNEDKIVQAVLRYFRRNYSEYGWMYYIEPVSYRWRRPDLLFLQTRSNLLHVVEAEPTLSRAFSKRHGFAQLKKYKGNYKWLALPKEEWEKDLEYDLDSECERTGIGLLLVSGEVRFHVREEIKPKYIWGDFLGYYPEAKELWREL